jgi:hypothetical protein
VTLRDAGKASIAYFYFDFNDIDKQKLCNLLLPSSSNFQRGLIPAVTSSPNSILLTIEFDNPMIMP